MNKCRVLFEQVLKFLSKSIISNFLENVQLIKSILNVTGPYQKVFSITKKFPVPLIHNNQFIVNFKEKSELFNSFFAKQFTYIETGSNLPTQILCRTNKPLNTINFTEDDVLSVIRKLDPGKVHGHDQINISMVQICDKAICKTITFYFFFLYRVRNFPN